LLRKKPRLPRLLLRKKPKAAKALAKEEAKRKLRLPKLLKKEAKAAKGLVIMASGTEKSPTKNEKKGKKVVVETESERGDVVELVSTNGNQVEVEV
jgi:hypothetical protein